MYRKMTPWLIVAVLLFTGFVTVREISNAELMKEIQKNDYLLKHLLDGLDRRIDGGGLENTDVDICVGTHRLARRGEDLSQSGK